MWPNEKRTTIETELLWPIVFYENNEMVGGEDLPCDSDLGREEERTRSKHTTKLTDNPIILLYSHNTTSARILGKCNNEPQPQTL